MPVIPATWETEAGELLVPGRQRLQWAKITPLHSSLGDRGRLQKKKKQPIFGVSIDILSEKKYEYSTFFPKKFFYKTSLPILPCYEKEIKN